MIGILVLAVALAMDAFAVSLVRGAAGEHSLRRAVETGLAFGIAQGLMPLLGWLLGTLLAGWIETIDHWIAFAVLAFLGGRMIMEGMSGDHDEDVGGPVTDAAGHGGGYGALALAALATSIDAAAAGLTLELFALPVWLSCLVIGTVTALICIPAYWFASRIGRSLGSKAEIFGGVVLIGIGLNIMLGHTGIVERLM